jgi:hypothetical protein
MHDTFFPAWIFEKPGTGAKNKISVGGQRDIGTPKRK